jgi:opacity protein-like surface antigen
MTKLEAYNDRGTKVGLIPASVLVVKNSETKTGVVFGGGTEYSFTPNPALRLSLTSYDMSVGKGAVSGRVETLLGSGVYNF